jgi:hypothetical protein
MISFADALGRRLRANAVRANNECPRFLLAPNGAPKPESQRVTFDILEQRRRSANVIASSPDRAHFEIPIDSYFDPLNFVELIQ